MTQTNQGDAKPITIHYAKSKAAGMRLYLKRDGQTLAITKTFMGARFARWRMGRRFALVERDQQRLESCEVEGGG